MAAPFHIALISLYVIENSGIRTLAAVLRNHGYRVTEVYFKDWINNGIAWPTETELRSLSRVLLEREVDLVGVSVRASAFIDIATHISLRLRHDLKRPILWGGIHPTSMPESSLETADAIAVGEAEDSLLQFVDKLKATGDVPTDIPGVWVRQNGSLIRNEPPALCTDLDRLPFRDFHSHHDKFYINGSRVLRGDPCEGETMYLVMAARGCVYSKCSFCINTMLNRVYPGGYRYRRRSVENVIAELEYGRQHLPHMKRIRFDDEIFPLEADWVEPFVDAYGRRVGLPFDIHLHPVYWREEQLRQLKVVGLDSAAIGLQSSERVNRTLYNRCERPEDIKRIAKVMHRLKIKACYQIILDDPISTAEDKRALFELLMSLPLPFELYLFSLTLYPGTDVTEHLLKAGLATPDDVEGRARKVFSQFRVDLAYPRSDEDRFYAALLVLVSKAFVPRGLLWRLAESKSARKHLELLTFIAQIANFSKMSLIALEMLARGELSPGLIRRWLNLRSLITQ